MTARDGKQLKVFIVLLVILSVVAFLSFRINQPSSASVTPPAPKDVADSRQSAASDTRIRLDLMKQDSGEEVGLNDLFQYHMGRSGGSEESSGTAAQTPLDPPPEFPPPVTPTPATDPPRPALPPAPPPMQFSYDGFLKT